MRYSPSQETFYPEDRNFVTVPDDLVMVSDEEYLAILNRPIGHGYVYDTNTQSLIVIPPPPLTLAELKSVGVAAVDSEAEITRLATIDNPTRAIEYEIVSKEADIYKASGYAGDPPRAIAVWASIKGWTATEATDDIIRARDQYINGILYVREIRLSGKAAIVAATTAEEVTTATETALAQLRAVADAMRQVL